MGADSTWDGSMHTRHADLEVSRRSRRLPLFGRLSQPSLDSKDYGNPALRQSCNVAHTLKAAGDSPADHPVQHRSTSVIMAIAIGRESLDINTLG